MSDTKAGYSTQPLRSLEICAGAGGQAIGLEAAGFELEAAVELEAIACETLSLNRPCWDVRNQDVTVFNGRPFDGIDLLAGGVPCPPFSVAGKQLGADDERDLFPQVLRLAQEARPRALMIENVRGLLTKRFTPYRDAIISALYELGYTAEWRLLQASDFGVPQLRPRSILVALRHEDWERFAWPVPWGAAATVGETLGHLMAENGWPGVENWIRRASGVGPTIVGGSKKHGGPDLGPTRARAQWERLAVDGKGLANAAPDADFPVDAMPRLTVEMVALIQGFPPGWKFAGTKTSRYRQVGNAFPPPVAAAVATAIHAALSGTCAVDQPQETQLRFFERLSA